MHFPCGTPDGVSRDRRLDGAYYTSVPAHVVVNASGVIALPFVALGGGGSLLQAAAASALRRDDSGAALASAGAPQLDEDGGAKKAGFLLFRAGNASVGAVLLFRYGAAGYSSARVIVAASGGCDGGNCSAWAGAPTPCAPGRYGAVMGLTNATCRCDGDMHSRARSPCD